MRGWGEEATTSYIFNFGVVWQHAPELLRGVGLTLILSFETMICGFVLGTTAALLQVYAGKAVRRLIGAWIEIYRNTPLLVQLFLVYFGLPQFGLRVDGNTAAIIALSLYLGAFITEIVRAGIEAVPEGQIEAGRALGLLPGQILLYVVLAPALFAVAPSLGSQFVIVMLTSSVVSTVSADELTSIVNGLQTATFRPFEFYFAASALYLAMALLVRGVQAAIVHRFLSFGKTRA